MRLDGDVVLVKFGLYCPECATVAGILSCYPKLTEAIDVRLVDVPCPWAVVA